MSDDNENVPEKESAALVPLEEKTVDFYGDQITAVLVETKSGKQEVYVPIRPLCDFLGLSWRGQRERIERDEILSDALKGVRVTRTPLENTGKKSGGPQDVLSLPLKYLPGWLFGIDAKRVKPELKEKIIRYRRECYEVLWQAFQAEALNAANTGLFDVETTPTQYQPNPILVQLREQALAQANLSLAQAKFAEQQLEIERQVILTKKIADSAHERLNNAGAIVLNLRNRLTQVEELIHPAALVSELQATEISNAVKLLANQLTKQGAGKNQYQAVFEEIYRRFGATGYKSIRRDQYQPVLDFLEEWRLSAGGIPQPKQTTMPLDPTPEA
ncbi:MAG: ORF6C domain-containing protein [Chloroflexi bacterium]|nr:ORF6C domain-containing protein [Chloroflexota bacterium]